MSHNMTKPTKWHVRRAKTQINMGIRPVWSEPSLSAWRKLWTLATHWAHSRDSDQTGCPGWSESSLAAQSFCWFYHGLAHISSVSLFDFCWSSVSVLVLLLSTCLVSSQHWILVYMIAVLLHWWIRSPSRGPINLYFMTHSRTQGEGCYRVKPV